MTVMGYIFEPKFPSLLKFRIFDVFFAIKSKNKLDVKAEKPYSSCSSLDSGLFDTSFYLQVHRTSIFFL